jgi:hypothetical protein
MSIAALLLLIIAVVAIWLIARPYFAVAKRADFIEGCMMETAAAQLRQRAIDQNMGLNVDAMR